MSERLAYHLLGPSEFTTEAEVKAKFSRFTCIVTNPAFTPTQFASLRSWLPQAYLLAAEVNAMRVPIPVDGSEPQWEYGKEIKRTFPQASLWRNACIGALVSDGGPQAVNYTIDEEVISWWVDRIKKFAPMGVGIYSDDSPQEVPLWLTVQRQRDLGLVDDDGDGFPTRIYELSETYADGIKLLTAAMRQSNPIALVANTGTPRVDSNLNGISIEISGLGTPSEAAQAAGWAFKAQLAASKAARRYPRLCIAWTKNQDELDAWRAVQAADPGLREVLSGIESSFTDWK